MEENMDQHGYIFLQQKTGIKLSFLCSSEVLHFFSGPVYEPGYQKRVITKNEGPDKP